MNTNLNFLTRKDIAAKLKSMKVGENGVLPIKAFSFLVENRKYDPDNFSQEIEDTEEAIDVWKEIYEEIHKPYFDFVWNNTISQLPLNSKTWRNNHSKKCSVKLCGFAMYGSSIEHEDGTRDYYSEELVDKIVAWAEKNGGIIEMC